MHASSWPYVTETKKMFHHLIYATFKPHFVKIRGLAVFEGDLYVCSSTIQGTWSEFLLADEQFFDNNLFKLSYVLPSLDDLVMNIYTD